MSRLFVRAGIALALLVTCINASAAQRIDFAIDWLPSGEMAPLYYGIEQGLFADAGFDVHITVGRGSSDVLTKLATGQVDYAMAGLPALLQASAEGDMPVRALLPIFTSQPDALMASSASGIESFDDLAGKRVATATFSSSNAVWPVILAENGIDEDDVTLIKADPSALNAMLANGVVDAVISWATNAPVYRKSLSDAGQSLKVLRWDAYGYEGYGYSLMTSQRLLDAHPDQARRFTAAFRRAIEGALAHPEQAARAVVDAVDEASPDVVAAQWRIATSFIAHPDGEVARGFDSDRLQKTWRWVARAQGFDANAIDPSAIAVDDE